MSGMSAIARNGPFADDPRRAATLPGQADHGLPRAFRAGDRACSKNTVGRFLRMHRRAATTQASVARHFLRASCATFTAGCEIGQTVMWRFTMLSMATIVAGILGGCATEGPKPTEQLTKARTLVEQAEKAQAQRYAPRDLEQARTELMAAETASSAGKYDSARSDAESARSR